MVKFAHIADVHLGGWKQPELQELNLEAFRGAIDAIIKEKPEFVLFAGDLFDSAYPPIEILKETFSEFKRLKEVRIPAFIIAGSHDSSASGKTFLDVLEKAGFCKNVENFEVREDKIILSPTIFQGVALYGYPGKRSGMEVSDLRKIRLQDSPGMMKILMLHTTIDKVKGTLPIDCVECERLPYADYYALGHIHIDFQYENFVYPGPIFPNNFGEMEDLEHGGFYIVDTDSENPLKRIPLPTKKTEKIHVRLKDATFGTDLILNELDKHDLKDKIVLLRISGILENGKISDIKFPLIEEFLSRRGAYCVLKNTHDLTSPELDFESHIDKSNNIELETLNQYPNQNPSEFNLLIPDLMNAFMIEKQEDEKNETYLNRLWDEAKKVLRLT